MTVVLHLVGGLGNQLFQLAAAGHLAGQSGRDLIVDVTEARLVHDRVGLLPLYDHLTTVDYGVAWLPRPVNSRQARRRQQRDLRRAHGGAIRGQLGSNMTLYTIDELESFNDDGSYSEIHMHGLFMSRAYAMASSSIGKPYHPQALTPSPWLQDMIERIRDENPVGMHVRRGDYLREPERGVLTSSYYWRAVEKVVDPGRPIWAFSDEPSEAQAFLGTLSTRLEFIQAPASIPAAESLMVLAKASTIIACNSTFSWWAGFLAQATVVIPRPFGLEALTWSAHQRNRMIDPAWVEVEGDYA